MNLLSFLILAFVEPWYIACPIMSFVAIVTFTDLRCPLTRLENKIRAKLKYQPIKTFIGYYFCQWLRPKNEQSF